MPHPSIPTKLCEGMITHPVAWRSGQPGTPCISVTRFIVCKESQQAQRDLQSIPATLVTENSTEVEQSRSPWKGQDPPEMSHLGELGTHLFPIFSDTANRVLIDKAGLDVKVLDFSAK